MARQLTKAGRKKLIRAAVMIRLARRLKKEAAKMIIKKAIRRKIRKRRK